MLGRPGGLGRSGSATALEVDPERGREVLVSLQVTARSYLGALDLNTGAWSPTMDGSGCSEVGAIAWMS